MLVIGGASGARCLEFQQQHAVPRNPRSLLAVPVELFKLVLVQLKLEKWLESHPQREDLYASLRPLRRIQRQSRIVSFLDEIDQLQGSIRLAQFMTLRIYRHLVLRMTALAG